MRDPVSSNKFIGYLFDTCRYDEIHKFQIKNKNIKTENLEIESGIKETQKIIEAKIRYLTEQKKSKRIKSMQSSNVNSPSVSKSGKQRRGKSGFVRAEDIQALIVAEQSPFSIKAKKIKNEVFLKFILERL